MYKGYPQPWRTRLLILTALIVALFIVQIVTWVFPNNRAVASHSYFGRDRALEAAGLSG